MKHLSVLIKPASSLCNMRCKYCFYADVSSLRGVKSFGIMSNDTMKVMIDNIYVDLNDGDSMTFAFQGGEPTLAGLDYFVNFVDYVKQQSKRVNAQYTIQTNGLSIDEKWCHFLVENGFLVGLSIDSEKKIHDENRVNANNKGTYNEVMRTKTLFVQHGVEYNVLCVLTNELARYPNQVFNFLKKERIKYIQFIPCLDDLGVCTQNLYSLTPRRFASFYNALVKLWSKELFQGNYISIKFFDDITHLLATGRATACGMLGKCQLQYIIEANGNTYPCDFYVLDDYLMGNITIQTLKEMQSSQGSSVFLASNNCKISKNCQNCPFLKICFGGCKRMKSNVYLNEEGTYCAYQDFLTGNIDLLEKITRLYR